MTGVGFLGADVIVKEGFTVRGLTTAAAIWVISAIGVLIGFGYFGSAAAATALTFLTLWLVRTLETRMPSRAYVHCHVVFARERVMDEAACVNSCRTPPSRSRMSPIASMPTQTASNTA